MKMHLSAVEKEAITLELNRLSQTGIAFLVDPTRRNIGHLVYIEGTEFSTDEVFQIVKFNNEGTVECLRINDDKIYTYNVSQLRSIRAFDLEEQRMIQQLAVKRALSSIPLDDIVN